MKLKVSGIEDFSGWFKNQRKLYNYSMKLCMVVYTFYTDQNNQLSRKSIFVNVYKDMITLI